jgi:hypothetical protein
LSFKVPVARMLKWLLGGFYISRFGFRRFPDAVEERPLVFQSPGSWNVETAPGGILHFAFRVSVIPDAVEERPLVFQSPGSRNAETTPGGLLHFTCFGFRQFPMQWRRDPLSFKVPVAGMPKRLLGGFYISRFRFW